MKKSIRIRARALARFSAPALSVLSLACAAAWGQDVQDVMVTTTRVEFKEMDAPYAVEVHTRKDIQSSGTSTLYDYLAKFSGLQVGSGFGNKEAPLISMRGFGLENGFQNMAVVVNGQKINSIDQGPPLLSAISLQDIERIEISRGVGASLFGDGATGGVMEITTKPMEGLRMQAYGGSYGAKGLATQVGAKLNNVEVDVSVDERRLGGYVEADSNGQKDSNKTSNWKAGLAWQDANGLKVRATAGRSDIDARYNNYLSPTQWATNPAMNQGISTQKYTQDSYGLFAVLGLGGAKKISLDYQGSKKYSSLTPWYDPTSPTEYDYKQTATEVALSDRISNISWRVGGNFNQAQRSNSQGIVHKDNEALFGQAHIRWDSFSWMVGARQERVKYNYAQAGSANLSSSHELPQWETGVNKSLDDSNSVFVTYSHGQLSPDVDRFYRAIYNGSGQVVGQEFNEFIVPAKVDMYTIGYNRKTNENLLKLSVFRANLNNEIYVTPSYVNTNFEKSHKYGAELQDKWQINSALLARLNYTYTIAKIDFADASHISYNGKNLPGVSRHMVVWGANWHPADRHAINFSQTWRSKAYAFQDYANSFVQRQPIYRSTDLSYDFAYTKQTQLYVSVSNLFDQNNAIVVNNSGFYAVDFARTWMIGLRTSL